MNENIKEKIEEQLDTITKNKTSKIQYITHYPQKLYFDEAKQVSFQKTDITGTADQGVFFYLLRSYVIYYKLVPECFGYKLDFFLLKPSEKNIKFFNKFKGSNDLDDFNICYSRRKTGKVYDRIINAVVIAREHNLFDGLNVDDCYYFSFWVWNDCCVLRVESEHI